MFPRRLPLPCFLTLAVLLAVLALAPAPARAFDLESRVVEHSLENGMKVLIVPRHRSPVVSLFMKFRAGAVDEEAGRSGTAHLLEHLMFKGTRRLGTLDWTREEPLLDRMDEVAGRITSLEGRREAGESSPGLALSLEKLGKALARLQEEHRRLVVKDEIDAIYTRNGAEDFNAFTDVDFTTYRVDLPANRLELWAAVEAERMREPVLREFYSERDVVEEERRQSYDSQPSRLLMELFQATAFVAHPYRKPIIGWPADIPRLTRAGSLDYFRRYYNPANAVLGVVGDVDPPAVIRLLERYFGDIPAPAGERLTVTREPAQRGERRVTLEAEANPILAIGWHKPTLPHRDDYVLDLVDGLLASGRTSRLYRRLVEEERVASGVSTVNGLPGARYDNLFAVMVTPLAGRTAEEAERFVDEELERLKTEPVSAAELDKVRRQLKADFIRGLESNGGLANMLAYFEALGAGWRYITRHGEVLDGIGPAEVMSVARRYFVPENRTVAVLRRSAKEDSSAVAPSPGGERPDAAGEGEVTP